MKIRRKQWLEMHIPVLTLSIHHTRIAWAAPSPMSASNFVSEELWWTENLAANQPQCTRTAAEDTLFRIPLRHTKKDNLLQFFFKKMNTYL